LKTGYLDQIIPPNEPIKTVQLSGLRCGEYIYKWLIINTIISILTNLRNECWSVVYAKNEIQQNFLSKFLKPLLLSYLAGINKIPA